MTDVYTPPANSALSNPSAPLAVVADHDVDSLSISFGSYRSTETVWQQGAFCYPYLRSTRTDARTFTVIRDDGWPSQPKLWVNDPALDSGGVDWGAVGTVDFAALSNATLVSGANTVDGVSIYVKGAAFGTGDGASVVNGAGLRQTRLTANTLTSALGGNAGIVDTLLYVPCDQFPDYKPNAPVAVQFRWNDLPTAYPSNLIGSAGMLACAKSAAAVTSAENGSQQSTAWTYFSPGDNLTNRTQYFWKNSGTSSANQRVASGIAGNAAANAQQATHVYTRAGRAGVCYHDAWGGSFADLQDLSFVNARLYPSVEGSPLAPSFGFFMYFSNAVGPSFGSYYATMRSMRVLQPKG